MRLELTRVGLLVKRANHYTTRGAPAALYSKSQVCQPFLIITDSQDKEKILSLPL